MPRITSFELRAVDLPFRKPFRHAAAERNSSNSLFLRCSTDDGSKGFGESLPRHYVTGETRDGAFTLLAEDILPRLVGTRFESLHEVEEYLWERDGKAPAECCAAGQPQGAAWCAVDLALLDTFGHAFCRPVNLGCNAPIRVRYSPVISADSWTALLWTLVKVKLFGFHEAKLKVDSRSGEWTARLARRVLGARCGIRVDANMCWSASEALQHMATLSRYGVRSFEQPVPADDLEGLRELVDRTGLGVMADESLTDGASLRRLIDRGACTAVNVRISKCGGLVASLRRCREAAAAGLDVQVGCQVGESSLLSAAHLTLLSAHPEVAHAEGCFGRLLLKEDPVAPLLQFRRRGAPPERPSGPGLGVQVDATDLDRWTSRHAVVGAGTPR